MRYIRTHVRECHIRDLRGPAARPLAGLGLKAWTPLRQGATNKARRPEVCLTVGQERLRAPVSKVRSATLEAPTPVRSANSDYASADLSLGADR